MEDYCTCLSAMLTGKCTCDGSGFGGLTRDEIMMIEGGRMKDLTPEEIDELQKEVELARKEKKEREERERFNPFGYYPSTYGWVCPVCGKGNAPWQGTCSCKDVKYYWSGNYVI